MNASVGLQTGTKRVGIFMLALCYLCWSTFAFCAGHLSAATTTTMPVQAVSAETAHCQGMGGEQPVSDIAPSDSVEADCCDDTVSDCDVTSPAYTSPSTIQPTDVQWIAVSSETLLQPVATGFLTLPVAAVPLTSIYHPPFHLLNCSFLL